MIQSSPECRSFDRPAAKENQRHRDPHEPDRPRVFAARRCGRRASRRGNQRVEGPGVARARQRQSAAGEDDERIEVLRLPEIVRQSHQIGAEHERNAPSPVG